MKYYNEDSNQFEQKNEQQIPGAPNGNTSYTEQTNASEQSPSHSASNESVVGGNNPTEQAPANPQSAPNTQQGVSYSYTRENIPDNTYHVPSQNGQPYNNPYYTTGGQNTPPQQNQNPSGGSYNQNYGQRPYNTGSSWGSSQNGMGTQQNGQNPPYGYTGYNQPGSYQPAQTSGNISYTPKKEKKHNGRKAAIAIACCAGLLLSTGFGFLGAVIAGKFMPSQETIVVNESGDVVNAAGNTAVFYRSVETLSTSTGENGGDLTMAQVSALVSDSVVEINTEFTVVSGWFQYVSGGAGSGVILSEDGYVITNNHVVCNSDGVTPAENITVRLTNGEEYKAKLIGTDSDADIAILKIDATGLTPAVCGNSDNLVVGESVVAVGNPLGELGGTHTEGIISALDREIDVNGVNMRLLQTSAAVNSGNSGGGLFNMRGELVGIVNAKSSGTGIEGLGFAIPVSDALSIVEQLLEYGYVRGKVYVGLGFYDVTDAYTARMLGLSSFGVYVTNMEEGYNDTVLQVGDRVISVNGMEITSSAEISSIVKSSAVGDVLKFQISRRGKLMEVDVTCYEKIPSGIDEVEFEEK